MLEPAQIIMAGMAQQPNPLDTFALAERIKAANAEMAIRQADEQRRATLFNAENAQYGAAQQFLSGQYADLNPAPVPTGTEADFFQPSPVQHQQQQQQFAMMDPRVQQAEVARMRKEQRDEGTFQAMYTAGLTAGELPDRQLSQEYVNWKARNGYKLAKNEFADPMDDPAAFAARAQPFVAQTPQGPYAPGMEPIGAGAVTQWEVDRAQALISMGMSAAQATTQVARERLQGDRYQQQGALQDDRQMHARDLVGVRGEQWNQQFGQRNQEADRRRISDRQYKADVGRVERSYKAASDEYEHARRRLDAAHDAVRKEKRPRPEQMQDVQDATNDLQIRFEEMQAARQQLDEMGPVQDDQPSPRGATEPRGFAPPSTAAPVPPSPAADAIRAATRQLIEAGITDPAQIRARLQQMLGGG